MNKHKTPRRAVHQYDAIHPSLVDVQDHLGRGILETQTFIVPRSQIKPYFERFEAQFTGEQSPAELALNVLRVAQNDSIQRRRRALLYTDKYCVSDANDQHRISNNASRISVSNSKDSGTTLTAVEQYTNELADETNHARFIEPEFGYDKLYNKPKTEICEHAIKCSHSCINNTNGESIQIHNTILLLSNVHQSFTS